MSNSSLSGNSATYGGLYIYENFTKTIDLYNTIIVDSIGGADCLVTGADNIRNNVINLIADGSCNQGANVSNFQSGDPNLGTLGAYGGPVAGTSAITEAVRTMPLLPGSIALDAGDAGTCPTTDQRGMPRHQTCDIGAFESQGFNLTTSSGDNQSTVIANAFVDPISVLVSANNVVEPVGPDGVIHFSAPTSGASLTTTTHVTTTDASGLASVSVQANDIDGSYIVTATTLGASAPVSFTLRNLGYYTVTVGTDGSGSGTVELDPPGGVYPDGQVVTVTASAGAFSSFSSWSGSLSGTTTPVTLTVDSDKVVTGTFALLTYPLSVTIGGNGSGVIALEPPGGVYEHGTVVTLTANAELGSTFVSWSGDVAGETTPVT
ncbi:MAG: hypothetical protein KDE31_18720, partial [Caldilineaceae bacterium]|nr:hypothetical protein [Caldilineaceae bacterium]